NPDNYQRAGFAIVDGGPIPQGLSLGESEISFAANIDDRFYGQLTLSYEDDSGRTGVNIEEAYIDTLALPDGLSVRLGRFFSNIGYLNSHHTHTDKLLDRALPQQPPYEPGHFRRPPAAVPGVPCRAVRRRWCATALGRAARRIPRIRRGA